MYLIACMMALASADAPQVEVSRNIAYYEGPGRDELKHRLDLFLPPANTVDETRDRAGGRGFPTIIFVHGGTWSMGSKDGFLFLPGHKASDHGRFFAERGVAAVQMSYRLSPKHKHPDHVADVARAIAWVRRNIARYGGDPDRIFIMGHSAGGHLVALVASDPQYLMAEGLTPSMIRGVVGISGVYALTENLRVGSAPVAAGQPAGPGVLLGHVFGSNAVVHHQASPIQQVRPDLPPFILAYADGDLLTLPAQAVAYRDALHDQGVPVQKLLVKGREHQTILKSMLNPGDPLGEAVLHLIRTGSPQN